LEYFQVPQGGVRRIKLLDEREDSSSKVT
jgi:hypothetical protein